MAKHNRKPQNPNALAHINTGSPEDVFGSSVVVGLVGAALTAALTTGHPAGGFVAGFLVESLRQVANLYQQSTTAPVRASQGAAAKESSFLQRLSHPYGYGRQAKP